MASKPHSSTPIGIEGRKWKKKEKGMKEKKFKKGNWNYSKREEFSEMLPLGTGEDFSEREKMEVC